MSGDLINSLFHLGGGLSLWCNVARLYHDKRVHGVWIPSTVFYTAFGAWNLWFYCTNGCPLSFTAAVVALLANVLWLFLAWHYSKARPA